MLLTEYNEAETMELFREEGRLEGLQEGLLKGRKENLTNLFNFHKQGIITVEQAAMIAGMSVDEFLKTITVQSDRQ